MLPAREKKGLSTLARWDIAKAIKRRQCYRVTLFTSLRRKFSESFGNYVTFGVGVT